MFPKDNDNPIECFSQWFNEAKMHDQIKDHNAMCLATTTKDGRPSARMVLLKSHSEDGFTFYTNLESRKAMELMNNPYVALCFYWEPLDKQVRIEGNATQVSDKEADAYFTSRARKSRIGAWASRQSRELKGGMAAFMAEVATTGAKYAVGDIPRPPHWSGFSVAPTRIEFWRAGEYRLHQRREFTKEGDQWQSRMLYP